MLMAFFIAIGVFPVELLAYRCKLAKVALFIYSVNIILG